MIDNLPACRIAIWDFIDKYKEERYLSAKKVEKLSYGIIKAKEPLYLWNCGWSD